MFWKYLTLSPLALFLISCSSGSSSGSSTAASFDPGCITVRTYSGGITLTGHAQYEYRTNGNGAVNGSPLPIRQAQVSVYNSSGAQIQCGVTDNSGNFSVVVPQLSDNYQVRIDARIYNDITKAGVFNNPTEIAVHNISTLISGATSASVGTLTAPATGTLKGGAFNILDKVLDANTYLATNTNNCGASFSGCTPFSGAPAVFVYWDKGVNPGSYFSAGALSFYLTGQRELYILGGLSGDTDYSDCDHFDNSIIIHEYGHFIEDVFGHTDSPGGLHTGDTILDPRLAWGEGWANFFQAAVLNNPLYRDTSGNVDGSSSVFFNEDLETPNHDVASTMGEGNFREFSVTRLLWDSIDLTNEGAGVDTVSGTFAELWTLFTSSTTGFKNSSLVFRNIGLFHNLQQSLAGHSDWSSLRTGEKHLGNQNDYARAVASASCADVVIQASNISPGAPENGSSSRSNQFASNDFYRYYHPGGSFNFILQYTTTVLAADLDVYIYKNPYTFGDSSTVAASATTNSTATSGTETISTTLPAGWYMIDIRVDTSVRNGNAFNYNMTLNGSQLCPN